MNKKATYYVFKGLKALIVLIRKDLKNLIGVLVFGITSMFGKLFYISFPIYAFGEYNLISNYNENNELANNLGYNKKNIQNGVT